MYASVKLSLSKVHDKSKTVNEGTLYTEINVPVLSSQQLIDCDRKFNNGCSGGNPYYAFQYVEVDGLVSNADYPFKQKVRNCPRLILYKTIAILIGVSMSYNSQKR